MRCSAGIIYLSAPSVLEFWPDQQFSDRLLDCYNTVDFFIVIYKLYIIINIVSSINIFWYYWYC